MYKGQGQGSRSPKPYNIWKCIIKVNGLSCTFCSPGVRFWAITCSILYIMKVLTSEYGHLRSITMLIYLQSSIWGTDHAIWQHVSYIKCNSYFHFYQIFWIPKYCKYTELFNIKAAQYTVTFTATVNPWHLVKGTCTNHKSYFTLQVCQRYKIITQHNFTNWSGHFCMG